MATPSVGFFLEGQCTAPFLFREGSCVVGIGNVRFSKRTSDTLYLSSHLLEETNVKRGQSICLQVGPLQRIVRIQTHKGENDLIGMSADTASALAIPKGKTKWILRGDTWRIGPFIALYTLPGRSRSKPFGELTELLRDWVLLGKEEGNHLYIVTPGSVDIVGHRIQAWTYDETHEWKKVWRPCPDFVIQKIVRRPLSFRPLIEREEHYFCQSGCSFLTRSIGSKWDVHQMLGRSDELIPFLPQTRLIRSVSDLEEMLRQHQTVFVKPIHGTQGERVFHLHLRHNGLMVSWEENGTPHKFLVKNSQRMSWLQKEFVGKRRYLVQQEVERLQTPDGEPVDFRWLLQKDRSGSWTITARVARIGQKHAVTTNIHSGGRVQWAETLLENESWDHTDTNELIARMDRLAEQIAHCIEVEIGEIGEMGIDLAVDQQGDLWFIEVNPRPGRKMLRLLDGNVRLLSLLRPLEYAEYTIGF
jgi:glutathione synthase/RimK-type ligase-like ATP-grasp enzyme